MGAILDKAARKASVKRRLGERLRTVPCFSSNPLRVPESADAFENLTGNEWRSIASVLCSMCRIICTEIIFAHAFLPFLQVMVAILIGLFHKESLKKICIQTFMAYNDVRFCSFFCSKPGGGSRSHLAIILQVTRLLCVPVATDSILASAEEALDCLFQLVPKFFAAFDVDVPSALTLHLLNHYTSSVRRFGTPGRTSTELTVELPHKASAKDPAKRVSRRDVLEEGAFRFVVARDALMKHFVFLATYHPKEIARASWGPRFDELLLRIDRVRTLGLPCVPLDKAHRATVIAEEKKKADAANGDSVFKADQGCANADTDADVEFDLWVMNINEYVQQVAASSQPLASGLQGSTARAFRPQVSSSTLSSNPRIQAGEVVVKTHGETTLRHPVAKYRHRARGILPKELARDFGGMEDVEHQLARFVLTKCMGRCVMPTLLSLL